MADPELSISERRIWSAVSAAGRRRGEFLGTFGLIYVSDMMSHLDPHNMDVSVCNHSKHFKIQGKEKYVGSF